MHRLICDRHGSLDGNSRVGRAKLSQPETQYLEGILRCIAERRQSGNLFPLCLLSVSTISANSRKKWIQSGDIEDTCFHFQITYLNEWLMIQCLASHFNRVSFHIKRKLLR